MKKLNNNSLHTSSALGLLWQIIKGVLGKYFNIMPDKENEQETIRSISEGVSFRGANLWILVFAIFTASLGLNVNSTAVIIGAMLISPLMGPIIGMGLSVGINDYELLKRSAKNYLVATLISVITATVYFLLTPMHIPSQAEMAQIVSQKGLSVVTAVADRLGLECHLVGGSVRDILLGRPSVDLDIVVVLLLRFTCLMPPLQR